MATQALIRIRPHVCTACEPPRVVGSKAIKESPEEDRLLLLVHVLAACKASHTGLHLEGSLEGHHAALQITPKAMVAEKSIIACCCKQCMVAMP